MLEYTFFRHAVIGIFLISLVAAVVGTYVVTRRLVSLAGGVTHATFGGLGLGYFCGFNPLWGALAFAVAASLGVERLSEGGRVRSDSAIAVVWAVGMALGVLFVFLTPGYVPELTTFLFGNILTIHSDDLWITAGYLMVLIGLLAWRGRQIVASAFDADFARVSGLAAGAINRVMSLLVAVGIVLIIRVVGVMLLMSMVVLPVLTAERFTRRYGRIMLLSAVVSLLTGYGALWLSAVVDVPCSALMVLMQTAVYGLSRLAVRR